MHIIFYNIFLALYQLGIRVASAWNQKAQKWLAGRDNIFETIEQAVSSSQKPLLWVHCASLGEFEQGRPLMEALRSRYPGYRMVLTFYSPSGYEHRKDYSGADHVFYLPADSKKNAKRFISLLKPSLVIWIKYDYWYYYLTELKKQKVPILLISANFRENQPFFKWYGRLHRWMLECFDHIFVQTPHSVALLNTIGLSRNVSVSGDTRFDRVIQIAGQFNNIEPIELFCGSHPVVVAGSTWYEDEAELDHYANSRRGIRFIIAPHETHEAKIKESMSLFRHAISYSIWNAKYQAQGASELEQSLENETAPNVLIIDNIGMLAKLYRYATVCFVGGGFGDDGVHNVLEAAVYNKPVVFGPVYEKYLEAVDLVELEGAFTVENALELEKLMDEMINDGVEREKSGKVAGDYVRTRSGATGNIMHYIQENRLLTN